MAKIIQSEETSDNAESTIPVAQTATPVAPHERVKTKGGLIASIIVFVALVFGGYFLYAKTHDEPVLSKATVTDAVSSVTPLHKPE